MAANVSQVQWLSTGWSGALGYTTFYTGSVDPTAVQDLADESRTFLNALAGYIPTGVTYTAPTTSRQFDAATGDLGAIIPITTPPSSVTGSGDAHFAAPSGAVVTWLTDTPAESRLVVGRTYIVPLTQAVYQTDGTLADSVRVGIAAAAATMVTNLSPLFAIWRRPKDGTGGAMAPVTAARCGDRVAILTSRRV